MSKTIREHVKSSRPYRAIEARTRSSVPYICEIAKGRPIGGTRTLASFVAALGVSGDEVLESLREWYPDEFTRADTSEAA